MYNMRPELPRRQWISPDVFTKAKSLLLAHLPQSILSALAVFYLSFGDSPGI